MNEFTIHLTEDEIDLLKNGDYNDVEAVIAHILEEVEEQQK